MNAIAIDLETTGLGCEWDWDRYRYTGICSIGFAHADPSKSDGIKTGERLLQLPEGIDLHPAAAKVNGFTAEALRDKGKDWREALPRFAAFLREFDLIVGQNILAFDWPILNRNLLRALRTTEADAELPHAADGDVFDTKLAFKAGELGLQNRPAEESLPRFWQRIAAQRAPGVRMSLDDILIRAGIQPRPSLTAEKHSAGVDAALTWRVYLWMKETGLVRAILRTDA